MTKVTNKSEERFSGNKKAKTKVAIIEPKQIEVKSILERFVMSLN